MLLQTVVLLGFLAVNASASSLVDPPADLSPTRLPKNTVFELLNEDEIAIKGAKKSVSFLYQGSDSRWLVCAFEIDEALVVQHIPAKSKFTVDSSLRDAMVASFRTFSADAGFVKKMRCGIARQSLIPKRQIVIGYHTKTVYLEPTINNGMRKVSYRKGDPIYKLVPETWKWVWTPPTLSELRCLFDIKIEVQEGTNPALKCSMGPPGRIGVQE